MLEPGINWLRKAFLAALYTHPDVQNSKVYYPQTKELVKIDRGRMYGGAELIEPGLTLSVHPYHSPFNGIKGQYSTNTCSISYCLEGKEGSRNTLSSVDRRQRGYHASILMVVQLFYRDAGLNVPEELKVRTLRGRDTTYHGYQMQYVEKPYDPTVLDNKPLQTINLEVQTLPGEEILTQWLDILKNAIRDIGVLYPFTQYRHPVIKQTDYPTTTWLGHSSNLVFHTAYHVVQWDVTEPPRPVPPATPVSSYVINAQTVDP